MIPGVNPQTPQGHFVLLTKALKALARTGDLNAFSTFVRGTLRERIKEVGPDKVEQVLRAVNRAHAACAARTPRPAQPKPIPRYSKKAPGIDWAGNPALRARLASLYAKHGADNHKAVAAEMRITVGQARLAKRRYAVGVTTEQRHAA